jgi:hypothetical protein
MSAGVVERSVGNSATLSGEPVDVRPEASDRPTSNATEVSTTFWFFIFPRVQCVTRQEGAPFPEAVARASKGLLPQLFSMKCIDWAQ